MLACLSVRNCPSDGLCRNAPPWKRTGAIATLLVLASLPTVEAAPALGLAEFEQLAARCAPGVAPTTLAAIALTESGLEPLAIHDNSTGRSWDPSSMSVAVQVASDLIAAGHSVDLGLMQVNAANLGIHGLTVAQALDPCESMKAGAAILADGYAGGATHAEQQAALRVAISRYNTGSAQRGFANGYVEKVEFSAHRVVPALDPAMDSSVASTPAPLPSAPRPDSRNAGAAGKRTLGAWLVWSTTGSSPPPADNVMAGSSGAEQIGIMAEMGEGAAAAVTYDRDLIPSK